MITRIKTANGSLFKQIIVIILYLISRLIIAATMECCRPTTTAPRQNSTNELNIRITTGRRQTS